MKDLMRKIKYVKNIFISLLLYPYLLVIRRKSKPIIIFGFGNNFYENNIRFVYEYFMNYFSDKYRLYAVFEKGTRDSKLINSENLLYRGSIKAYSRFLISKAIIFDTYDGDVAPGLQKRIKRVKKIFITHGMEGLKNVDYMFNKRFIEADLMFAASEYEKNIKNKYGFYPNVKVTGYPRFDKNGNVDKEQRKIVILFTWRDYLTKSNLETSEYYTKILNVVKNPSLSEFCVKNNITCYVKIHHRILKLISGLNIELPNIITNQSFDFSKILSESMVLITDYSSLAWDYIFHDKPVLFYQFDKEEYEIKQGVLYTDVKEENLGICVKNENEIVEELENMFSLTNEPKFKIPNKLKYYNFEDNNNTNRVVEEIINFIK